MSESPASYFDDYQMIEIVEDWTKLKERSTMVTMQKIGTARECGCSGASAVSSQVRAPITGQTSSEVNLETLLPIAVVIAAGCEPCAKLLVEGALQQGSSKRQIQKVLAIVAQMQKFDCLADAVGPDVIARMGKPLAVARKTLEETP